MKPKEINRGQNAIEVIIPDIEKYECCTSCIWDSKKLIKTVFVAYWRKRRYPLTNKR